MLFRLFIRDLQEAKKNKGGRKARESVPLKLIQVYTYLHITSRDEFTRPVPGYHRFSCTNQTVITTIRSLQCTLATVVSHLVHSEEKLNYVFTEMKLFHGVQCADLQ